MHKNNNCKLLKRGIIYALISTLIALVLTRFRYVYGSQLDWSAQHFAIPDYFRKLFYDTGEFFPSFAPNIGGGENIYNLSYYGLDSPVILFSYLLPFVPMNIYIQAVSFLGVIASTVIFYYWMTKKSDNEKTAFLLGLIFLFSAPIIFHSHRHIMFTGYMPFLLLSLIAVDDYFEGRKKYKLVLFSFLTIMCCYFFAISALCVITIYGIYKYLTVTEKFTLNDFIKKGTYFAGRIITAICMSAVLLVPTFLCLLSGRDKGNSKAVDLSTFLPDVRLNTFLFDTYSMGLGVFVIASIICAVISRNKSRRFLGIVFAVFGIMPVFVYGLNGFLYFDGKVMIAFLPLGIMLMGQAYEEILSGSFRYKIVIPITAVYCILSVILSQDCKKYTVYYTLIDLALFVICLLIFRYKNLKILPCISMCLCVFCCTLYSNFSDKLLPVSTMKESQSEDIKKLASCAGENNEFVRTANSVNPKDTSNTIYNTDYYSANIYSSLHNKNYNNFYFHEIHNENALRNPALTVQSENLCSDIYMSEKYLIKKVGEKVPSGYKKIKQAGEFVLYENDNVLPFGYVSYDIIDYEEYKRLDYPQSVMTLLNYTVVENSKNTNIRHFDLNSMLPDLFEANGISEKNQTYYVNADTDITKTVKLPAPLEKNEILFISFDVDNKNSDASMYQNKDIKISINGMDNTLTNPKWKYYNNNTTFEYTITTNGSDKLDSLTMNISKGRYKISNLKLYTTDFSQVKPQVSPFRADKSQTKGDKICGSAEAVSDGYFNISIPFTKGFSVKVDGQEVECEKVDTAFLGFKVKKGHHNIEIRFTSPGLKAGKILSLAGVLIFTVLLIIEYAGKRKKSE